MQDGTTDAAVITDPEGRTAPDPDLDRSALAARLGSGRALLALVVPFAAAALLVRLLGAGVLIAFGAVVEDGEVVASDLHSRAEIVLAVLGLVVMEVGALLGVGAALVVLAREAVAEPVRWREVWTWPSRHRRAAWAVAGAGLLLQVAGVAAWVLTRLFLGWAVPELPERGVLVAAGLAAVVAVAALVRVLRSAADLLVVGTLSHPGVIQARWVWGQNRKIGGTVLLGGIVLMAVTLLLALERSALGWPVWAFWAVVWSASSVLVLIVLAMCVDDSTRVHGMPPRLADRRAGVVRWGGGTAVLLAPLLVLALLVQIDPAGLVRYQRLEIGLMTDVPVVSAGGGTLIERDDSGRWSRKTVMCQGARCVDLGFPRSQTATTLSEDGSTVWAATWEYDDPYASDPMMTLHLRAYPVDALPRVPVTDAEDSIEVDGESLQFPSGEPTVDLVVAEDSAEVMHPGEMAHAYDGQTITAVAERDGVVVLASSYNSQYDSGAGPLYVARCTAEACATERTTHVMADSAQRSTIDVAIGPDGTGYVTAFGSAPVGSTPEAVAEGGSVDGGLARGLALFVLDPSGGLTTHQVAEGRPVFWGRAGPDLLGADVVVAEDGTVWMLLLSDDEASLLRCTDATCADRDAVAVPGAAQGLGVLAIDATGRPMIATSADGDVALLSCTDERCTSTERRVLTSGVRWLPVGLVVREGRPVVVVHDPRGEDGGGRAMACVEARCGAE